MKEFARQYFDLLTGEYAGINLTRIIDFPDFYNKQVLDSIYPFEQSTIFSEAIKNCEKVIDVGFGGGFPIIPLAKLLPAQKFLGVETRGKKAKVVGEISEKLGVNNTSFLHERIENVLIDVDAVVTFKAVGMVWDFLSKINSTKKIKVFFYKGPNFYTLEKDQLVEALKHWNVVEEKEIQLDGVEGRYLIGFENKNVPCGTNKTNNLVKVSSIK